MKKHVKLMASVSALLLLSCLICGFGGPAPVASEGRSGYSSNVYMIDDFEDGDYTSNPEWWKFDNVNLKVVENKDYQNGEQASLNEIKKY